MCVLFSSEVLFCSAGCILTVIMFVLQGVLTKSDGDWEQVAVKMIKDTDLMSQSAFEDMDREIGSVKLLILDLQWGWGRVPCYT